MSSLRDSLELIRLVRPEAGTAALEHEIQSERASSLSAAERRVRDSLSTLAHAGAGSDAMEAARAAVWAYFVQRELIGFRRHDDVIRDLNIPSAVLAGLGAVPKAR